MTIILKEKTVAAKKEHRCSECNRKILPDEKYLYEVTVFEGDFDYHKTCPHCLAARKYLTQANREDLGSECDFYYGQIYEDLHELSYESEDWKAKIYACGMRRQWVKVDGTPWKILQFNA